MNNVSNHVSNADNYNSQRVGRSDCNSPEFDPRHLQYLETNMTRRPCHRFAARAWSYTAMMALFGSRNGSPARSLSFLLFAAQAHCANVVLSPRNAPVQAVALAARSSFPRYMPAHEILIGRGPAHVARDLQDMTGGKTRPGDFLSNILFWHGELFRLRA